jgi:hypothetical protein
LEAAQSGKQFLALCTGSIEVERTTAQASEAQSSDDGTIMCGSMVEAWERRPVGGEGRLAVEPIV